MVIGYLHNFSKNSKARFEREQIRLLGTLRRRLQKVWDTLYVRRQVW